VALVEGRRSVYNRLSYGGGFEKWQRFGEYDGAHKGGSLSGTGRKPRGNLENFRKLNLDGDARIRCR